LLQWLWNFVTNLDEEVENIKEELWELYDIYQNRHEIFAELDEYKKHYYISYIETTIQIALVPIKIGKLNKVKQPKDSQSITEMRELKDKWCNYWEITTNSYIEVASSGCKRTENRDELFKNPKPKIEARINHIMTFTPKWSWKYSGLHSTKELEPWSYNIEYIWSSTNKDSLPYNAKITIKTDNWDLVKWWNDWISTMYPDSWDRQKIIDEVSYAIKNKEGKYEWPDAKADEFYWYTQWWIQINFYINSDGTLGSYFPKL
jgi:hypothetical protein